MALKQAKVGRRRRVLGSIWAVVMVSTALVSTGAAAAPGDPVTLDQGGRWGPVEDWPMIAIHSALDRNGRVVTYGTNPDGTQTGQFIYDIWTPGPSAADGHRTLANTTTTDLFCSLQLNRSDTGDMILFGGDNWTGTATTNRGNPDINQISATTGQMTALPGMNRARWYATGTTLPDGSIYVQGGLDGEDHPEHWTPQGGAELLDLDTSSIRWYYPRNFVIPDGRIFGISTDGWMYYISESLDSLDLVGRLPGAHHADNSSAVMFEPGRILFFGGYTTKTLVIDVTGGATPVITETDELSTVRQWVDGTLLPDGRVLATGGGAKDSAFYTDDPISTYGSALTAEIWDPATGRWTVGAAAQVPRLYHSTSLLLPDGRVLTAGGGAPGPINSTDAELFSPDYLVRNDGGPTPRLEILDMSTEVASAGQRIDLTVSSAAAVERVTLVKSGSVTHSFNMDQRFVELDFTVGPNQAGNTVSAYLPVNDATITPGFYLVSVLDSNDIPSVSQILQVTAPEPGRLHTSLDGEVLRLYWAYFLRDPDQAGFVHWRRQRLNGAALADISQAFAQSPEFRARYGVLSNPEFVDQLYLNVLGRPAEPAGRAYWTRQLMAGAPRGDIMLAFSESSEFMRKTGTANLRDAGLAAPPPDPEPNPNPGPTPPESEFAAEIRRLYLGYFLREPDRDGLAHWTEARANGTSLIQISERFARSIEFEARYGHADDPAFVDLVYQNVLNRKADEVGKAYWVHRLRNGMTRGEMMVGFTESPENVAAVG